MSDARPPGPELDLAAAEQRADLLSILRRQWTTIMISIALGALCAAVFASIRPTVYESRSTLLLVATSNEQSPGGGRGRTLDVETWATVARSTAVLQDVADELDMSLEEIRRRSTATAAPTGDILVLTFEADEEDLAVTGAATYSQKFLEYRRTAVSEPSSERTRRLEQMAADLTEQIETISAQIAEEEAKGDAASASQLAIYSATQQIAIERLAQITTELADADADAEVEVGRVLIDPRTTVSQTGLGLPIVLLSGILAGGLLGFIVALLRDRLDDRYGSTEAPTRLGLREMARVPYYSDDAEDALAARNAYTRLLTHLVFTAPSRPSTGRSILLLPVDSETLPSDVAQSVAGGLERSARSTGVVVRTWSGDEDLELHRDLTRWQLVAAGVQELCAANDLVLVPERPLTSSAVGLGLAALVDETLLLVSTNTPIARIQVAVEDLHAIHVDNVQVVVVTDLPRQHALTAGKR